MKIEKIEFDCCRKSHFPPCFRQLTDFNGKHILLYPGRTHKKKKCEHLTHCGTRSNMHCSIIECKKIICRAHELKICHDCVFHEFKEEFVIFEELKIEPPDEEPEVFKQSFNNIKQ